MEQNRIISSAILFTREHFKDPEPGHDYWHGIRVRKNTLLLLEHENANRMVCELAALLHDIADPKFHAGDEEKGPSVAADFLEQHRVSPEIIREVLFIIRNISFAGNFNKSHKKTTELAIVQDADRLDAMGAIGIARAFSYGGYKRRTMYDPDVNPVTYNSVQEYRNSKSPTINHFHEKLLLLKDLMNTDTGRKIAEQRHKYMENFLEEFHREWKGEI